MSNLMFVFRLDIYFGQAFWFCGFFEQKQRLFF